MAKGTRACFYWKQLKSSFKSSIETMWTAKAMEAKYHVLSYHTNLLAVKVFPATEKDINDKTRNLSIILRREKAKESKLPKRGSGVEGGKAVLSEGILINPNIRYSSIASNTNINKLIVSTNQCQQHYTKCALVIEEE
eukprot:gene3932-15259_t